MEEALKQATEQAHKQRMELEKQSGIKSAPAATKQSLTQETSASASELATSVESKALQALKE
jgi:hypothetical protein